MVTIPDWPYFALERYYNLPRMPRQLGQLSKMLNSQRGRWREKLASERVIVHGNVISPEDNIFITLIFITQVVDTCLTVRCWCPTWTASIYICMRKYLELPKRILFRSLCNCSIQKRHVRQVKRMIEYNALPKVQFLEARKNKFVPLKVLVLSQNLAGIEQTSLPKRRARMARYIHIPCVIQ